MGAKRNQSSGGAAAPSNPNSNGDADNVSPASGQQQPTSTTASSPMSPPVHRSASRRALPVVEDLAIPPHVPQRRSILSQIKYKFYAELAMGTLEPWERAITNAVLFAIMAFSLLQGYRTMLWLIDEAGAALSPSSVSSSA